MALRPSGEYYFDGGINFPNAVYIPARESEEWALRLRSMGILRLVRFEEGIVTDRQIVELTGESPYVQALQQIRELENDGHLAKDSFTSAMYAVIENTFDESPWATYLPQTE